MIDEIKKLNIGAGPWWRKPAGWHTLDNPSEWYKTKPNISQDLTKMEPLPLADGQLDLVYITFLLEHLDNKEAMNVLKESFRCLKPGGWLRVSVPDMKYELDRLSQGIISNREFIQRFWLLPLDDLTDEQIEIMLADIYTDPVKALAPFPAMVPPSSNADHPEGHRNWFDAEKLHAFILDAGFDIVASAARHVSMVPELCKLPFDDNNFPDGFSLYCEAQK